MRSKFEQTMEGWAAVGQKEKKKRNCNAAGSKLHIINCTLFFLVHANLSASVFMDEFQLLGTETVAI